MCGMLATFGIGMSCCIASRIVILLLVLSLIAFCTDALSYRTNHESAAVYQSGLFTIDPRSVPNNADCQDVCLDPYTSKPDGTPCGCVIPIRVGLEFSIPLYALFPLVSELSDELASGTYLSQSQVRIIGANAMSEDVDKTQVTANLMPLGETFDKAAAAQIAQRFWTHQVAINEALFGNYSVLFVHYPGLPLSPPSQGSSGGYVEEPSASERVPSDQPSVSAIGNESSQIGSAIIAAISIASSLAASCILLFVWVILIKCCHKRPVPENKSALTLFTAKKLGTGSTSSNINSTSMSLRLDAELSLLLSSVKTFSVRDLKKATSHFSFENIIGEGGFGRVYQGTLKDGTQVAVKVLTRGDKESGHEFKAEVEMLSRLHHDNLVKLLGICMERHARCLVYELIQNRTLEWHLHGPNKSSAPLKWQARLKIALGSARALAYLHEDSNPRVIHRDFKASNILLEDDCTPRVSDFGLAKFASSEAGNHVSTRVMGTFGYVAPEYAMTGHLLVKSDVYSYGVVLLELLSGRRPVDMSKLPGQENLVTWARSLLTTSKDGLEVLVDPALRKSITLDAFAEVAAIALRCVEPEVSQRPFMSEVVQSLEKIYNDFDNANDEDLFVKESSGGLSSPKDEVLSISSESQDNGHQNVSDNISSSSIDYEICPPNPIFFQRPFSASAISSNSGWLMDEFSGSFRSHNASCPLKGARSKPLWYRLRHPTRGTTSEQGTPIYQDTEENRHYSDGWS
ncbi:hypothetical protein O6H91_01G044000 [Diphasiastrum complanatum]|uniref:Uncharacterized protein n=2 Tax=Diphasiastrum complanatum TaxID=34168 RepID=A0ACC2EQC8_DIPCM|nr:hypothetical protein O6H91_01G044000 [Diphasiastrum complanatum]KAJ7568685.1 hypothetical protein O6H91_01G044000 [Diphasiastrum complanatum]